MKPSVSVCMKLTIASSSASERPRRPTQLVLMLSVNSGAGQHVVPSPESLAPATRQDVPRVVEMHDLLQAREISVVHIGLHEVRIGRLSTLRSVGT